MRRIALAVLLVVACVPGVAQASGFGWYVCSVDWRDFDETVQGLRAEASELLAEADTPKLRAYLQLQADSQIVAMCDGANEGPIAAEFYDRGLAAYARTSQEKAGVRDTYFRRFGNPPDIIAIERRTSRPMIDPVYFVLSPKDVAAFHAEVAAMNKREHPPKYAPLLRHLEAVLLKTLNDHWSHENDSLAKLGEELGNGRRGLIFFGHD